MKNQPRVIDKLDFASARNFTIMTSMEAKMGREGDIDCFKKDTIN
jgi:hypothetical protein